jgi:hypothetical protein
MPEKDKEKTMPHVLVKLWPGKTAQQKTRMAVISWLVLITTSWAQRDDR